MMSGEAAHSQMLPVFKYVITAVITYTVSSYMLKQQVSISGNVENHKLID